MPGVLSGRTRAVLAAACVAAVLMPAAVAHSADQDLTQKKSAWTGDNWHKINVEFTFHPGVSYQMMKKRDADGRQIWGVSVPDLSTVVWQPKFEFGTDIWTSNVISGGVLSQRGTHPVYYYAALYTEADWKIKVMTKVKPVAEVRKDATVKPSSRIVFPANKNIKCDSGKYYVEWAVSRTEGDGTRDRQPHGTVEGVMAWDSHCGAIKKQLSENH